MAKLSRLLVLSSLVACSPFEYARRPIPTLLEPATLRIFYFPIGMHTSLPMTSEDIEKREACIVSEAEVVGVIKGIIASATPTTSSGPLFGRLAVRVKAYERTPRGESLLAVVDNRGEVRDVSGDGQLSLQALTTLKLVMDRVCDIDCDLCPPHNRCDLDGPTLCIPKHAPTP
jgi:hypothetical protein